MKSWRGVRVYTIGHSTRSLDELVELLRGVGVSVLVDIRTIPRSRHNPQFDAGALAAALPTRGLRYAQVPALGGLRHARKDSVNAGFRNASFRGYADYMQTPGFEEGLAELRRLADEGTVAIMCAEAVPWRCHRSLVADALTARGARVEHVTGPGRASLHRVTPFARVDGARVTYPGGAFGDGRLVTRAPFHLEATVRLLQRRPANRVEVWERASCTGASGDRDRYLRVLPAEGAPVLVEVTNYGSIDRPDVRARVLHGDEAAASRAGLRDTLRRMLGLDVDPRSLQRLAEAEPRLRGTARALRGARPPRFSTLFEAFVNVVPFQQVSLDAGVAVSGRLVESFGARLDLDGRRFHASPTAEAVAGARLSALRRCGLSATKAASLRGAARAIASGALDEDALAAMSTDEALRRLTSLPGIGPWSAGLVLLRGLGRLDVFPAGDAGAARGLGALLGIAPGPRLARAIERFGDARGYLYFCSLGASLLAKGLIHEAPAAPPARGATPGARGGARQSAASARSAGVRATAKSRARTDARSSRPAAGRRFASSTSAERTSGSPGAAAAARRR
jgi:DNA-3-methyladenine glycosylase II